MVDFPALYAMGTERLCAQPLSFVIAFDYKGWNINPGWPRDPDVQQFKVVNDKSCSIFISRCVRRYYELLFSRIL
jgi:hypothetical protein